MTRPERTWKHRSGGCAAAAVVLAVTWALAACPGSRGRGGEEPDGCYQTCMGTCGRETRGPDAPTCADECAAVCAGRRAPAGGEITDDGGVASSGDAGSTGAVFTVTDP